MHDQPIYRKRVRQFIDRVVQERYGDRVPLSVTYTYDKNKPVPIETLESRKWKAISPGSVWGELWGSAWFQVEGSVPASFAGEEVVALIDLGSEAEVFRNGTPFQGLTDAPRTDRWVSGKRRIALHSKAKGGEKVELLIEAGANALFGYRDHHEFVFKEADVAVFHREIWQIGLDLEYLYQLEAALPKESVRARRILTGLNEAANVWADGNGAEAVQEICARLLKNKAEASATTVWSVGHAHLDLGWLWPVSESRRKAGRTYSTALRLLEEYPDYVFGASQPQAYAWVKEDYPELYSEIRKAVKGGRWECQGAMWVEPDMNITGGESLVRQLVYGKRFFREEFGKEITNLWLPDVFGYSAALPQLLKLAGVDYFMTQKISWNETNTFPHHTFDWEGIDGTRIRAHFLPTNNYNAANTPEQLIAGEHRFAQADVSDDWLNLYGIGDGGGGPSREHIEYARRAANTEGVPKVKLSGADPFFARIGKLPAERLPLWRGELYLELHRGTYTTQAQIKKFNRQLELTLRNVEFLSTLSGLDQRGELREIWQVTLLNQFHDILPGSSIQLVYAEANAQSRNNLTRLDRLAAESLSNLHGPAPAKARAFVVYNTLSWERTSIIHLPGGSNRAPVVVDAEGRELVTQPAAGGFLVRVTVPSMGSTGLTVATPSFQAAPAATDQATASLTPTASVASTTSITPGKSASPTRLENKLLRVELDGDGTIKSIYDKEFGREVLAGAANRFLLWEDYPYSWDAWDISHYYRETTPEQARLLERNLVESGPLRSAVRQVLEIGSSRIEQRIVLEADSRMVRIENHVDWHESKKHLRVQAEPAIHSLEASYEIQFGTVSRPAHGNTSWDAAKFEVAAHRFADFSQVDYGLGLVNDSKYGHRIWDGVMDLTLLRSPDDPDPTADIGSHDFVFGYYPHASGWQASDLLERSHELNSPLLLRATSNPPPAPRSEFQVTGGTVKIEVVKPAEDGKGVVLRLYETRGANQKIVLRSRRRWVSFEEVNLLEDPGKPVRGTRDSRAEAFGSEVPLSFGPYQIRSFRMVPAGSSMKSL